MQKIVLGIIAEEVLYACDENTIAASGETQTGGELGLANPAVHFFRSIKKNKEKVKGNHKVEKFCGWKNDPFWHLFRGLRHRNLSAIRHATQRGLHQLQQLHGAHGHEHGSQIKSKGAPLMIQGFRSNPKDPESHILFFDIEALIGIKPFSNVVQPKLIFF